MKKPGAESHLPDPHVTADFQNRSEQNETYLGETIHTEPEQERESVQGEEHGASSEDEHDMEQFHPTTIQVELHIVHQEDNVPIPPPEHQIPLRQSTRERQPGYVFTCPSLGQPAYQPQPTVSAVGVQPVQCTHQCLCLPYFHHFQPPSIAPYPYLPVMYPAHCG